MTRIIAGAARGRRLAVPGSGTRPTSDRVREALFSALESEWVARGITWPEVTVLDLFAGTGALGLEALSRGATRAQLVERARPAARTLAANVAAVGCPGAEVVTRDAAQLAALPAPTPAARLVFADPPYDWPAADLARLLDRLRAADWIAPDAVVVVERPARDPASPFPAGLARAASTPVRGHRALVRSSGVHRRSTGRRRGGGLMRTAVCPGSFDPVTNGHLDVFARAAAMADEVVVAVLINHTKAGLFTIEERIDMLREVVAPFPNIRVDSFHGLLVDYCGEHGITAIVKGLRAVSDFDYELQMAQMNYRLSGVETMFITTNPLYSFLSSSLVKEVAKFGGDVEGLVPDAVLMRLRAKLSDTMGQQP